MTDTPWYPPEEDGSPPIIGPGGWWERKAGSPCRYGPDALINALWISERSEQSYMPLTDDVSALAWSGAHQGRDIVAYRLACPEARRLEKRVAELDAEVKRVRRRNTGGPYGVSVMTDEELAALEGRTPGQPCPCRSSGAKRQAKLTGCTACEDRGVVTSATGALRPCSRCRKDDFTRWYA